MLHLSAASFAPNCTVKSKQTRPGGRRLCGPGWTHTQGGAGTGTHSQWKLKGPGKNSIFLFFSFSQPTNLASFHAHEHTGASFSPRCMNK